MRNNDPTNLRMLLTGMRSAYSRGENAMQYARQHLGSGGSANLPLATLIAYDLQAGSYVKAARANPQYRAQWCNQLAALIQPVLPQGGSILEVGVGEATTLSGVLDALADQVGQAFGFDISWSRIKVAQNWLEEHRLRADLFVADLFDMPLQDASIDVVYTSHSIEPNGGRESEAIRECLRVARHAVVLVEPLYELASEAAQVRMQSHGYVRGLKAAAEAAGARVLDYRLLECTANPLNPSGVLLLQPDRQRPPESDDQRSQGVWQCPITHAALEAESDLYYAPEVGIAYPVLRNVPLLRPEHAVVASRIGVAVGR